MKLPSETLPCTFAYNKFCGYCLPNSSLHRPASKAVQAGRAYERHTIDYMMANCGDGDIIHAGAYFGDFLPALSGAITDGACIWSFEPNLENFRCAEITLKINNLTNVDLTNAGLGEAGSIGYLKTASPNGVSLGGASRVVANRQAGKPGITSIKIVAIDEIVPADRQVSILQLDVEGYEKAALLDSLALIERCRPILILEQLDGGALTDSDWFKRNILSLGYSETAKIHSNVVYCVSR
ncbi:FkbM family methyltransferase [Halioglobus maricola]|uniref:FkbM family methyltransferase n=1 Tax=Halioglobus maricola TaxID=2601894 RepID=A0A5P9NGS2_9GAMM|nr:FkbM family methyltransferase [Halioglobus maricola]QFU74404.1 FkbM family methyltransferase [Halioglobus maricola]